MSPNLNIFAPF